MKTPLDFSKKSPFSSVFQKTECEIIARNIMVILSRTGNKFRDISFEEYKKEREKDGDFWESELLFFDRVKPFCKSEEKATEFSKNW